MAEDAERRTERIPLLMAPSEVKALDDWAFANRIRSRGEAIRQLIEAGLKATDQSPTGNAKPSGGGQRPSGQSGQTVKQARSSPRRTPKAAPVSKEAQLRAVREQGARY